MVLKSRELCARYVDVFGDGFVGKLKSSKLIADVGCAEGSLLEYIEELGISKNKLWGCDKSSDMVEIAKEKGFDVDKVDVSVGLIDVKKRFDVVFCLDVIEHLENTVKFLRDVETILSRNGVLVLSTPNLGSLSRKILEKKWFGYKDGGHVMLYCRSSLEHLLECAGFDVEVVRTISTTGIGVYDKLIGCTAFGGQLLVKVRKR